MEQPLLLMTGAAGKLGTWLRPALARAGWRVRLSDLRRPNPLLPGETFMRARLDKPRHMRRACADAGILLHLGAASVEGEWHKVILGNVTGLVTTFEAARAAGVRHIVFPSSMHVLGMHSRTTPIDENSPFAPDSRYGATKLFGEGVARLFSEKYGMRITVLRIGHVVEHMSTAAPGEGVAAEDLVQLVLRVLASNHQGYRLYHAVAPHEGYPLSDGRLKDELGFEYRYPGPDRANVEARLLDDQSLNPRARIYRGGHFAGYD